jgi:Kef-type K+ transport system membrane component KefB
MVLLVAWMSEIVGITSLIGAFSVGLIVPRGGTLVDELANKIEDLITVIFLPIFFTVSGLRTQFGLVDRGEVRRTSILPDPPFAPLTQKISHSFGDSHFSLLVSAS